MPFQLGQRWISDTESELGLGTIVAIEGRMLTLLFPASGENRLYARNEAPITRVMFNVGDQVLSHEDWSLTVTEVTESSGIITYMGIHQDTGEEVSLRETFLNNFIKFNKPQDRLFAGQIDRMDRFVLRHQTLQHQFSQQQSALNGIQGPRVSLIPHQLHIATEVGQRHAPRVLLADEVGLGKTIEAGLIIHQQLTAGLANRVLILVPETLQHQWLVEMMRRFNLHFSIFDEERCIESLAEADNPFETEQLILCSLDFLRKKRRRFEQAVGADWDLLVVDEAHHLRWSETEPSREYQVVEALAQKSPGVLLLTATPDQLGHESHFARLRLLDPNRFYDYAAFVAEENSYSVIAQAAQELLDSPIMSPETAVSLTKLLSEADISDKLALIQTSPGSEDAEKAKQSIISQLLDRHGTGRLLFRNTRSAIKGFPTRYYKPIPLALPDQYKTSLKVAQMMNGSASYAEAARRGLYPEEIFLQFEGKDASWCSFDPRVEWLQDFLLANKNEKVLVIAANAETAMSIEESLRVSEGIRGTVFHEGMSIIARDKAGAYFAQEDAGAQVLLCSEIGSEGRNFQFAQHLVLFDLPLNPDLLEQRIGRLDRIGQKNDISIHVPFFTNTAQDVLQNWYQNGLNAFEYTCPIGGDIFAEVKDELLTQLAAKEIDLAATDALITDTRSQYEALKAKMESGRDRLLELNSNGLGKSDDIIAQLKANDDSPTLPIFAIRLFDVIGINQEDRGENMLILKPTDQMLIPSLPHLSEDGITVTFDRDTALSRDDVHFLTWEHPLIRACIELIMTSDTGSTAVSLLKNPALPAGTILLELLYVVETSAPPYCQINRFLPATPIRLLLDKNSNNLAGKVDFDSFNRQLNAINRHVATKLVSASQTIIHDLIGKSTAVAEDQKQAITNAALAKMQQNMSVELERLQALQKINPNVRDEELAFIEKQTAELTTHINNAQLKLDAVRFIVVTPS